MAGPATSFSLDRAGLTDLLTRFYSRLGGEDMLAEALTRDLVGRIALVSSFGADSIALIHLVARIAPDTPVLFIDTRMLFPETLRYQKQVCIDLGLTDMRIITPDPISVKRVDASGDLHKSHTAACCAVRKVDPLAKALEGFDAWISGRKRYQGGTRSALPMVEVDTKGRLKLNPLANWDAERVRQYINDHDLPPHPLVAHGYPPIGCPPCTSNVSSGEAVRSGPCRRQEPTAGGIQCVDGRGGGADGTAR